LDADQHGDRETFREMFYWVDLQASNQAEGTWVIAFLVMDVTGIGRQDWQEGAASCQEARNSESRNQCP